MSAYRYRIAFFTFAAILLSAFPAYAADGEHAINWIDLAWRTLTLALVIAVIWRFAGKNAIAYFSGRREGIDHELRALEERKQEAMKNLESIEKRIAGLAGERDAILAEYTARAEAVHDEIIAKARASAELINQQARQSAQSEIDAALVSMRGEIAEAVAEAAKEILERELNPQEHEKLIDSLLTKVVLQ